MAHCIVDQCQRPLYARCFCRLHYRQKFTSGELQKLPPKIKEYCSVNGCNIEQSAKGLCKKHYRNHKVMKNPIVYKAIEDVRTERARQNKIIIVKMLGGCCSLCGYNRNYAALEFHHREPSEKEFEPKSLMRKKDINIIMKEIGKCILVCKNCHTEIHHPNTATLPKNDRPIMEAL